MSMKSRHLNRRTFLRGTGLSLGLPWLECMQSAANESAGLASPARLVALYFGFGVALPKADSDEKQWRWFPEGTGRDYQFTETLRPIEPHRGRLKILGGLSHPNGRRMGSHDMGDMFPTAAYLKNRMLRNSISFDQVAAQATLDQTRFSSLVMSTDGGVGEPTRSSTLSYDDRGGVRFRR
jgi:hypothetical protein